MLRQNCVQVNNVNKLSTAYIQRFFGKVGPISKIEKNEISNYVTIQFVNRNCVDRVFCYEGRILDKQPIRIRRLQEFQFPQALKTMQREGSTHQKSNLQIRDQSFISNGSQQELYLSIRDQIMPHRFDQSQQQIISILIWRLADQLATEIKHIKNYNVNLRSSYLKRELQKLIIERVSRKNGGLSSENMRPVIVQGNDSEALVWYSVPYPNCEEEQTKIEAASVLGKCIATIRTHLSIRIADNLSKLYTASLFFNKQENEVDQLINLQTNLATSNEDSFEGIIENIGTKDIFYDLLRHQVPNSCVQLRENKILQSFQCTMRLECPKLTQLKEQSWCNFYRGQLCRKLDHKNSELYYLKNIHKIYNIKQKAETLIFESSQFSLFRVGKQLKNYRQIFEDSSQVEIVYIAKQSKPEKITQFKKVYEDQMIQIQNQVQQFSADKQRTQRETKLIFQEIKENEECIDWINIIEIKYQNFPDFTRNKLSHYLANFIKENVVGKSLVIPNRDAAYKIATNIIAKQSDNRLFDLAQKRYLKYIREQLWRLYLSQTNNNQVRSKQSSSKQ